MQSEMELMRLNEEVTTLARDFDSTTAERKLELAPEIQTRVDRRAEIIHASAESHPSTVLTHALSAEVRSWLPASARNCVEAPLEVTGELAVLEALTPGAAPSTHVYLEVAEGERYELRFPAPAPEIESGRIVRARGIVAPCAPTSPDLPHAKTLVLDPKDVETAALRQSAALSTTGEQKVAVILVSFSDKATTYTQETAQNVVFDQTHRYWLENSSQQSWLSGTVLGPYTIALSKNQCSPDTLVSQANAAAAEAGADLSEFPRRIYVFPRNSCSWAGLGTIGGNPSRAWINGAFDLHTVAHELGHNLGLYHSNASNCGSSAIGASCSNVEYGDIADAMGNHTASHFNAFQKERIGWLGTPATGSVLNVAASGTYFIEPFEAPSASGSKALKILKGYSGNGSKTHYFVEYRQGFGFDLPLANLGFSNNLVQGVLIHTGNETNANTSALLHMNPSRGSWYQASLEAEQLFEDAEAQVSVKLVSADAQGAWLEVSIGEVPTPPACVP